MVAANKLTVLQNMKWEKGVLGSFLNDPTKQKKCEKWKEVIELSESQDWLWQHFSSTLWQGWIQFLGASSLYNFWGLL
jgi:hypothetical protein